MLSSIREPVREPSLEHLEGWSEALRQLEPVDPASFLASAAELLPGPLTLGTAFGKEGCALIHLIATHRLPVTLFTLDTGLFFPETYALWRELEERYGITVRAVRPRESVEEQAARLGPALWERQPDRCCHLRKVMPLREALEGALGWVTGVRRSHSLVRRNARLASAELDRGVVKLNPLVSWSDLELEEFLAHHRIPHNPLHARGYPSVGCWPCTSPVSAGEDPRAGRWRGRDKTECGIHADFSKRENRP